MLIAAYLNTISEVNFTLSDIFANLVGYAIGFVIFTVIPAVYLYLVCISKRRLKSKRVLNKFGNLIKELRYWDKWSLFYRVVYLLRRVIVVFIFFNPFL